MSLFTPAGSQAARRAVCVERRMHGSEGGVGVSSQEAVRAYPTETPPAARGALAPRTRPKGAPRSFSGLRGLLAWFWVWPADQCRGGRDEALRHLYCLGCSVMGHGHFLVVGDLAQALNALNGPAWFGREKSRLHKMQPESRDDAVVRLELAALR